jgi:RHH-type rel operon transcriptional repressor/antitoxin RelB
MLAIRLPSDIEARLDELAKRTGRTKTFYVREAIIAHIADIEDVYLAESRLEDLRAGKSQSFALDDVERDLGLAD